MKKNAVKKTIRTMMIATLLAVLFCVVFFIGLKWMQKQFVPDRNAVLSTMVEPDGTGSALQPQVQPLPDITVQLVFVTDEDGRLDRCFYTVLDCPEGRLDFYMVPTDVRLQLSVMLYQELVTKNAQLAQVNTLEGLYRSFTANEAPECAMQALGEAVGVSADYYTVMPKDCCNQILKENAHQYTYDSFLQENLQQAVCASGSMKAYLTALWEQCESNISVESRMYYLETYEGLTNLSVSCRMVAGERHNNGYLPDGNGLR